MSIPTIPHRAQADSPLRLLQVYVDDFCHAATQSRDGQHLEKFRRAAVHGIQAVFPETTTTKHKNGKEPILQIKLDKGDGNFDTMKGMIGFEFNGKTQTVCLSPKKQEAISWRRTVVYNKSPSHWRHFKQQWAGYGMQL
jgi:hypothetical protein